MKGFVRLFIALELPPEIQRGLDEIVSRLKRQLDGLAMRWVKLESIHLTMKFIGDLHKEQIQEVGDLIEAEAKGTGSFEIRLNKPGVFPDIRRPRVLWVGLDTPQSLLDLQRRIEDGLSALGHEREKRSFSPHLTIARFKRSLNPAGLDELRSSIENMDPAAHSGIADSITLFKSELKPDGPVYNRQIQIKLSGSPEGGKTAPIGTI